jgi:hypothetical protein
MGPICGICGVIPAVFRCMACGTVQGMYMPGMAAQPALYPGLPSLYAPVFQAPASAAHQEIQQGIKSTAQAFCREFVKGFAGQAGHDAANAMAGWM